MTRTILRTILTTLAVVLLLAGSFHLNRTSANEELQKAGTCTDLECGSGPTLCAVVDFPDGSTITCYMR